MSSMAMTTNVNGHSNPFVNQTRNQNPVGKNCLFESDEFGSDEFRMFSYKIMKCPIKRTHDWTVCPYAHRGERARRRDPRRVPYVAADCPEYRATDGVYCPRGELCPYAHGVFEFWLHPAKYRTQVCTAGQKCDRAVCFFAHSPSQLRPEQPSHLPKWARLALRAGDAGTKPVAPGLVHNGPTARTFGATINEPRSSLNTSSNPALPYHYTGTGIGTCGIRVDDKLNRLELEFLESLKKLRVNEDHNYMDACNNMDVETPNIDWVSDLLAGC